MKNQRLWILLAGLALGGAAFLLLDYRLAVSNTGSTKVVMTTDTGPNMPNPMQRNDKITLVLVGEGPLIGALQKTLTEKLGEAGMGEIELLRELDPEYQNPVLIVKVGSRGPTWTPFFARSEFPIHAGYSSDGDSTFMEVAEKTRTSTGKKDAATMYAEFNISDLSVG